MDRMKIRGRKMKDPNVRDWRIEQMIELLGGLGLESSFTYTGATRIVCKSREDGSKPDPSLVTDAGLVDYQVGIQFKVNGKRFWKMVVSLEPSDTYTVRLWQGYTIPRIARSGKFGEVLYEFSDVYCDSLQDMVEHIYDLAVDEYLGGFIPLGGLK